MNSSRWTLPLAASLLLILAAACGDAPATTVVGQAPAATTPAEETSAAATPTSEDDAKEGDQAGELSTELADPLADDDKVEQELTTETQPALMTLDGRVCEQLPLPAIRELIGPEASFNDVSPDTCTYTAVVGTQSAIISLTRTEFMGDAALFQTLVDTVAESLDADMTAEVVPGIGDAAFLLEGGLGTYLHARTGPLYLVVFVDGADDGVLVAEAVARLALGS